MKGKRVNLRLLLGKPFAPVNGGHGDPLDLRELEGGIAFGLAEDEITVEGKVLGNRAPTAEEFEGSIQLCVGKAAIFL